MFLVPSNSSVRAYKRRILNFYLNALKFINDSIRGAAAVLGTMLSLSKLNFTQNVVGLLCLTENAIGPKAFHMNTILTSYKGIKSIRFFVSYSFDIEKNNNSFIIKCLGLTVEITNTDAEGRLLLADALTYAQKHFK